MLQIKPRLSFLEKSVITKILEGAYDILSMIGFKVEDGETLSLLADAGLRVDYNNHRAYANADIIDRCLNSAPKNFKLYNQERTKYTLIGGDNVHFVADSTQIKFYDMEKNEVRPPTTQDMLHHAIIVDKCENISLQAGMQVSDVPREMADVYRYLIVLLNSDKPVYSAFFTHNSFDVFEKMQLALAKDSQDIRNKPTHIVPSNISSPLSWSSVGCINLVRAAKMGVPSWLIPIPLAGATSPATMMGTLVQIVAENLSGIVIQQIAGPGVGVVWGGGPTILDMKTGTSPMSTPESILLSCGSIEIAKYLGLPTATNVGRSDAQLIDAQAEAESAMAFLSAALAGINLIRGSGSLAYASIQCLEKLVIDNQIQGLVKRLVKGMSYSKETLAVDLIKELGVSAKGFLESEHTVNWFKNEMYFPSNLIDRGTTGRKLEDLSIINERAKREVKDLLSRYNGPVISKEKQKELIGLVAEYAREFGMETLPLISLLEGVRCR